MKQYKSKDRDASLQRLIPDLYDYKSVLYIGARSDRFDYGEDFRDAGYEIIILEIFKTNVRYLRTIKWVRWVICGDARRLTYSCLRHHDIIFWWHGPEHIKDYEIPVTVMNLEKYAKVAVVLGCPWGYFRQGAIHGNEYEEHVSSNDYQIFEQLGYTVECLGKKDERGSNITAVKYV